LIFEPGRHLVLQRFPQYQKLSKSFSLESLDVLVLLVKFAKGVVLEFAEGQRFVCALSVDLLMQVVFGIVDGLHDILLPLNSSFNFGIESVLQLYNC
jgi:hypothetical protein